MKKRATAGDVISLRLPPEILKLVDDWRRDEPDIPVRSEAIRRMLEAEGKRRATPIRTKPRSRPRRKPEAD